VPSDAADARALLRLPPADYVTERARLVKEARAEGDRARASFYQSLKRPPLSLWAVLAAGDDADAVHGIVTATTELAELQAASSDARALSAATRHRRKALEAFVDRAVNALARWDSAAETRRPEIRGIVDQLSRHPDLAEAWIDGTLRDVPDEVSGFAAFADFQAPTRSQRDTSVPARRTPPTGQAPTPQTDGEEAQRAAERRAARAAQADEARQDVVAAARDLAAAEQLVELARTALREAEDMVRRAEDDRSAARQRHEEATARLEALQTK
jgi:hypothetical protein